MVYFCADDYGLNEIASAHILQCVEKGALNKVSVFPNFDLPDLNPLLKKNLRLSLHLNLVEGRRLSDSELPLIATPDGMMKHTFGGLLKASLLHPKRFGSQVEQEIRAQVLLWKNLLPEGAPFCIDSHQHTHMIPAVFKALIKVLKEEQICPDYLRIPAEPITPFLKAPSLYFTYNAVNVVKQWLLNLLWFVNKKELKKLPIPTARFFGILFSGRMDEKRVQKILPAYLRIAEKEHADIEVLFHPGYLEPEDADLKKNGIVFQNFYSSKNRKTEFDSAMNLSERRKV